VSDQYDVGKDGVVRKVRKVGEPVQINPAIYKKPGAAPANIVSFVAVAAWALFFGLGLGMALGKIDVTWFGVTFVLLCFVVGAFTALALYGAAKP
jgi:hypothetical protein